MTSSAASKVRNIFAILAESNANPTTELNYTSNFELLVSVVLSAQATDVGVNKATSKLFAVANTPQSILALGIQGLEIYIKSIGLYKTKARNIIGLCQRLINEHDGAVPDDYAALVSLPGVGRKTANVVLNTAFGYPSIAVDTHIFRVSNRLGIATGKNVVEVEHKLNKVVPDGYKQNAHHWLILHGRYICKARKPICNECMLTAYCTYYKNMNKEKK